MRLNDSHWKFGIICFCPDDPRVVIRVHFVMDWTRNIVHADLPDARFSSNRILNIKVISDKGTTILSLREGYPLRRKNLESVIEPSSLSPSPIKP